MKLFVSGLVNIETAVVVRGFPIDYYPIDFNHFGISSNMSGVGYNIAKALTTLGDTVDLNSFIGNDEEADRVIARMQKDGIDSSHIMRSLNSTPTSVVLYDPQGKRQIYCDLKDIQELSIGYEAVKERVESSDAAVLCNIEFNRRLIKSAKQNGVLTATDVHVVGDIYDNYNRDFMANADILFLSDENSPCVADSFIRQLEEEYHNRIIVIGMGAKGAMLLDSSMDKLCVIPSYRDGKIVNTVGAGDALFSAFMHFFVQKQDAETALRKAVIFAGVKIASSGASVGFCTEHEIEERYRGLYVGHC